jgi:hypothetical protein
MTDEISSSVLLVYGLQITDRVSEKVNDRGCGRVIFSAS